MTPTMFDQDSGPTGGRLDIDAWLQAGVRLPDYLAQGVYSAVNPVHYWFGGTYTFQPDSPRFDPDIADATETEPESKADDSSPSPETAAYTQSSELEDVGAVEGQFAQAPSYAIHFWDGLILSTQADAVYMGLEVVVAPVEIGLDAVVEAVADDVIVSDGTEPEVGADYAMAGSFDDTAAMAADVDSPLSSNLDLVRWAPAFETLAG